MNTLVPQLASLTALSTLFQLFNGGKHLNRVAEPALWAELEREQGSYLVLFSALGFELKIEPRGYAWFQIDEANGQVNKTSRRLALLWMCLFDTQADEGKPLSRFMDWRVDHILLAKAHERHKDLLEAEGLALDGFISLLDSAAKLGFALSHDGYWQLLPAVYRYLEHFESLVSSSDGSLEALLGQGEEDTVEADQEEEEDV
ncbi:hypothetical protein NM74_11760 [Aeromonas hydrophila]|jgi:hypothetical protein|uniref:condensin complex protein MksE n=1 Tax=Aeromonas hydrophila TaxID=644 RepID=UPI000536BFB3|nr:hypothetical protein [Aeromonas hydrophila]KHA56408.1 hypothetical protein NM74_11760 [Aeromonas hydrophila]